MNCILFSDEKTKERDLIRSVKCADIKGTLEICSILESVYMRLRQPALSNMVAVLYVAQKQTLKNLIIEKRLIQEIKTIFILADDQMETIVTTHILHPRFVLFEEDLSVKLPLVLSKMNRSMSFCSGNGEVE